MQLWLESPQYLISSALKIPIDVVFEEKFQTFELIMILILIGNGLYGIEAEKAKSELSYYIVKIEGVSYAKFDGFF